MYQRWPMETKENNEIGSNTNLFLTNFIKKEPTMVLLNQTLSLMYALNASIF